MRQRDVNKGDTVIYNGIESKVVRVSLNHVIIEVDGNQPKVSYSSLKSKENE